MRKLEWAGGAKATELQGVGDGVGLLAGGRPLLQCVGGDSSTRNALQLGGERNGLGAHWPVGEYLVPSKVKGRKDGKEASQVSSSGLPCFASLSGGKAQGGQRLHLQGHAGGAWLGGSPPAPESLGLG